MASKRPNDEKRRQENREKIMKGSVRQKSWERNMKGKKDGK